MKPAPAEIGKFIGRFQFTLGRISLFTELGRERLGLSETFRAVGWHVRRAEGKW
jgi:hypothetical protein